MPRYKVGQRIKLKEYGPYGDYAAHAGELAEITRIYTTLLSSMYREEFLEYQVKWENNATSAVSERNIILMRAPKAAPKPIRGFRQLVMGTS